MVLLNLLSFLLLFDGRTISEREKKFGRKANKKRHFYLKVPFKRKRNGLTDACIVGESS